MKLMVALALSAGVFGCAGHVDSRTIEPDGVDEESDERPGDGGRTTPDGAGGAPGSRDASAGFAAAAACRPASPAPMVVATGPELAFRPLHKTVEMNMGETTTVKLVDGQEVTVKLIEIQEN